MKIRTASTRAYCCRGCRPSNHRIKRFGFLCAIYFEKLKTQASVIFNGAAGINALQNKDYPKAQANLKAAVEGNPNELRNVYPLALAYLTGNPPNQVEGLFFIARAANLAAGSPGQQQIEAYGKNQYVKYQCSDQGWTDFLSFAKTVNDRQKT
jgi:hypothetical protein